MKIEEQERVLNNSKKNMIVSASAGSGKTYVLIQYICRLVCEKRIPIKNLLILTFTKAAATEMKERLLRALKAEKTDEFILKQIDDLSVSNISTIHSFCEYCLKKYANILKINENFEIADENVAKKLKFSAIKNIYDLFKNNYQDELMTINFAFRNDYLKLRESVFLIESMLTSVSNKEEFIDKILNSQVNIYLEAEQILSSFIDKEIFNTIDILEKHHFEDIVDNLSKKFLNFESLRFIDKVQLVIDTNFPPLPKKNEVGAEELNFLKDVRKDFNDLSKKLSELALSEDKINIEKEGKLEKALINFYLKYEEEYKRLKQNVNVLDFSDLEQYMLALSHEKLFNEKFDYVFIDEYQDTNSLQEKIVKKVAEKANFVAVGDAKQGIYGFRLASSEIFLRDVEDFSIKENSNAIFLKSNFRSSVRVLNFINEIFKDTMTLDTANIDYLNTSMLSYKKEYKEEDCFAINIDMVAPKVKEEKKFDIYSVKNDDLTDEINFTELETIKVRIEEILKSKIYDPDIEDYRQVEFKDIAIISRSRNTFFNVLGDYLKEKGIPVITSSKKLIQDNPEIQILINILKITLCFNDDVALLSILMSNFGRFNQDEIYNLLQGQEKTLTEIVQENLVFDKILNLLEKFKQNALAYGYKRAFEILFDETNYYPYLYTQNDEYINTVNIFLSEIEKSGFDFDLPSLISYFENV